MKGKRWKRVKRKRVEGKERKREGTGIENEGKTGEEDGRERM